VLLINTIIVSIQMLQATRTHSAPRDYRRLFNGTRNLAVGDGATVPSHF
jgi:hypothetical protein